MKKLHILLIATCCMSLPCSSGKSMQKKPKAQKTAKARKAKSRSTKEGRTNTKIVVATFTALLVVGGAGYAGYRAYFSEQAKFKRVVKKYSENLNNNQNTLQNALHKGVENDVQTLLRNPTFTQQDINTAFGGVCNSENSEAMVNLFFEEVDDEGVLGALEYAILCQKPDTVKHILAKNIDPTIITITFGLAINQYIKYGIYEQAAVHKQIIHHFLYENNGGSYASPEDIKNAINYIKTKGQKEVKEITAEYEVKEEECRRRNSVTWNQKVIDWLEAALPTQQN